MDPKKYFAKYDSRLRFEAVLKNDEHVIISRQYVSILKEKLGLQG